MYFEPKMLKVQTGQIIEFYSNSCSVVSDGKNYKCKILGRINLVVGDLVKFERVNDGGKYQGIVTKRNDRLTVLHKSKENIIVIDEKDLLILENAILSVTFTKRELLKLNYSLTLH